MANGLKIARGRFGILRGLLMFGALGYVALFVVVVRAQGPEQVTFGPQISTAHALGVYADVLGIEPVREEMQVRLDFTSGTGLGGTKYGGTAAGDAVVTVADGYSETDIRIRRGAPMPSTLFSVSLRGALRHYPFDRYGARLNVAAVEPRSGRVIPARLTLWKGVAGWDLAVKPSTRDGSPRGTGVTIAIARPGPQLFFACVIEAIMIIIAVSGVTIGRLAFIGARRRDDVPIGVLIAMVFALPVVRSVLPGAPPLGVYADILVFLWAELAVVSGLVLAIAAWARNGSHTQS